MIRRMWCIIVLAVAAAVLPASIAVGERAAGLTSDGALAVFDTSAPNVATVRPIGPLATPGEKLVGIDVRPATGQLHGLSTDGAVTRTYVIDPANGAATLVGSFNSPVLPTAARYGVDFNPVVDRIRVADSAGDNLRVNPTTGILAGTDVNLTFPPPSTGPLTSVAYDRNVVGATQTTSTRSTVAPAAS